MFENATKLQADDLRNKTGFELPMPATLRDNRFVEYYLSACAYVAEHNYLRPSPSQIEAFLKDGEVEIKGSKLISPIEDEGERKFMFIMAQAKQLIYDYTNGRGSMLRGEDKRYNVCEDFVTYIKQLGLFQRTLHTV